MTDLEMRGIPPKMGPGPWNALWNHGLRKPATCILAVGSTEFEATSGENGVLLEHNVSATAVLLAIKNRFKVTGALVFAKAGDYPLTATFPDEDVSDAIILKGEGKKTRFLPTGAFDAIDPSLIQINDLVWRDAEGVDHDATLDPYMFEEAIQRQLVKLRPILVQDNNFTERWEQGFLKEFYHGRGLRSSYFITEARAKTPYENWTEPTILEHENIIGSDPWDNALLMINRLSGGDIDDLHDELNLSGTPDEIYIGFPGTYHRACFSCEAYLPTPVGGKPHQQGFGFEVNSGGAFAFAAVLVCNGGQWMLWANGPGGPRVLNVTLNNPSTFARYQLRFVPPYLELWEAPVGNPAGMPVRNEAKILDMGFIQGRGKALICNEDVNVSAWAIGDIWIYELMPEPIERKQLWTNPSSNPVLFINTLGRKHVAVWAQSIAAGKTVRVMGSQNGLDTVPTSWHDIEKLTTAIIYGAEAITHKIYVNAWRYILATIEETGTGVSRIELSTSAD